MTANKDNPSGVALLALGSVGLLIGVAVIGMLVVPGLQPKYVPPAVSAPQGNVGGGIQVEIVAGSGVDTTALGYSPDAITVVIGVNNTVTWTNTDTVPHTVTGAPGGINSGNMNNGATYSYTFTTPGVYQYKCLYHPWMHGTVTVK